MSCRFRFLCAGVALLGAGTGHAQRPGSVEVGAYGQLTVVEPSQARFETRTPLSLGLRGRVNLHRAIGMEIEASTGTVEGAAQAGPRRYNQLVARGTVSRDVSEFSQVLFGAGVARTDYEVTYNFGPSLLFGVRTVIRGRHALRSDAIVNYLPASGAREFGLRTGIQTTVGPFVGPTTRDRERGRHTMQEPGSLELAPYVQHWQLDRGWNLRNGPVAGTRVGVFLTSRSAVEVDASYGRLRVAVGGAPGSTGGILRAGETFRHTTFSLRATHLIPLGRRAAFSVGVGPSRSSYEYVDHWGASAIGGVRLALSRDLQMRTDAVAQLLPHASAIDLGLRVGISGSARLGR